MSDDVARLIASMEEALDDAASCLPPGEEDAARAALLDAVHRYERAGDHTVVALVGGTGSGKSSLFNALTGTDFADDGVLRPTTRRASSCSWGGGADSLLDFLGVDRSRRMTLDGHLDQREVDSAKGLVLLDLPDNDSVEESHLKQVEQLLPVADVLAWVVDPQKYADHLLHANYLQVLRRRADAMVVIVNQIDTLTPEGLTTVLADVKQLLVEDGLPDVDVLTTCALTGDGVDGLWRRLTNAVKHESTARRTIEAEIAEISTRVLNHMGSSEAAVDDDVVEEAVAEFLAASGVPAVTDAIRSETGHEITVRPQPPGRAAVAAIGSTWAARATEGLPGLWADAVEARLPSVRQLQESAVSSLESVPVPKPSRSRVTALKTAGWVLVTLGFAAVAAVIAGAIAPETGLTGSTMYVLAAGAAVLFGAAIASFWRAPRVAAEIREAAADAYEREVSDAVREDVRNVLVFPTADVLTRHANARAVFEAAASS